jgi:hypothetical protein
MTIEMWITTTILIGMFGASCSFIFTHGLSDQPYGLWPRWIQVHRFRKGRGPADDRGGDYSSRSHAHDLAILGMMVKWVWP